MTFSDLHGLLISRPYNVFMFTNEPLKHVSVGSVIFKLIEY